MDNEYLARARLTSSAVATMVVHVWRIYIHWSEYKNILIILFGSMRYMKGWRIEWWCKRELSFNSMVNMKRLIISRSKFDLYWPLLALDNFFVFFQIGLNFQDSGEAREIFNLISQKSLARRNNKSTGHGLVVKPVNPGQNHTSRPKMMKQSTLPNPKKATAGNQMLIKSFSIDRGIGSTCAYVL